MMNAYQTVESFDEFDVDLVESKLEEYRKRKSAWVYSLEDETQRREELYLVEKSVARLRGMIRQHPYRWEEFLKKAEKWI